jgi:mRNA interferase HigB
VHIISPKTLRLAADAAKDAARELEAWLSVVRRAKWENLVDLKRTFPNADYVKPYIVFNIRDNRYRLIAKVYYVRMNTDGSRSEGHVYVRAFLTHKEYDDRKNWE